MTVVQAMLSNAAVATGLALIAFAVGRARGSPALRHAVWMAVLLKLVTPPLFSVPLAVLPASWAEGSTSGSSNSEIQVSQSGTYSGTDRPILSAAIRDVNTGAGSAFEFRNWTIGQWLVFAWGTGVVGWFVWQGRRVLRFRRRVARAEDASPEVVAAALRIAGALGIARPPEVKIAVGIGSPMLWGLGRNVVILFPRDLLPRLSPEGRDTLLAHELAHFLRRDHWVRVLEFVATGLYWWHPVVWLARLGVEAAEEECCDAWVVGGLASSPRGYAEALLATVDFEAELRRPRLPPGACAANRSARLLRQRLFALIHADRPPRLRGWVIVWMVVVGALLVRPVLQAAAREVVDLPSVPTISYAVPAVQSPTPSHAELKKIIEPRSWATTATPGGGLTVLARDNEVVLRFADGTQKVLGPGRPLAVAFVPGSRQLTTVGPGTLIRNWNERGELIATARVSTAARALAYTPDGSRLLVLDAAGEMTVRDPHTLAMTASWYVDGPANSITCSPDGRTVAVSCGSWLAESGWVELWSMTERKQLARFVASGPVGASRFTPDGRTLVMGGWNGLITWRSLPSGELFAERQLTKDLVATAAFSSDAGTLPLSPPPEPVRPPLLEGLSLPSPLIGVGSTRTGDRR